MLWEVEILPLDKDPETERVSAELRLLTARAGPVSNPLSLSSRGYLFEGVLSRDHAEELLQRLLLDPLVEEGRVLALQDGRGVERNGAALRPAATVLPKPGVMDPVAESVLQAAEDLGVELRRHFVVLRVGGCGCECDRRGVGVAQVRHQLLLARLRIGSLVAIESLREQATDAQPQKHVGHEPAVEQTFGDGHGVLPRSGRGQGKNAFVTAA